MSKQATVTMDGWSVSVTTGSDIKGARLQVFRGLINGRLLRGDADGKMFETSQAAWDYALEHGYIRMQVTPWCPWCRTLHRSEYGQRRKQSFCFKKSKFIPTDAKIRKAA